MSDDGAIVAFLWVWIGILGVMIVLYIPILFIRFMEHKSGDPMWLGNKLFGKRDR